MNRPIKLFMNLKLRWKLFLSYLLIITLVIIVNYVVYKTYESNTIKAIESSSTSLVQQLSNNIAYKMTSLDTDLLYATGAANIFNETDFSDYVILMKDVYIFNTYLQNSGVSINSELFVNASDACFYYSKNDSSNLQETNIYKYLQQNKQSILNASGRCMYVKFNDEPNTIYIAKSNITLNTHQSNGILAIGISDRYFKDLFSASNLQDGSIVVCDQNSNILSCDEKVIPIVKQFNKLNLENISGQNYFNYNGEKLIIESEVSQNDRWKVLYVISLGTLLKNVENIKEIVSILCICLFFFSMTIAFVISGTLTSNIRLLLKKIKTVEQGDFSFKVEPKSTDETTELFNHFNIMSEKLSDLINRIANEQIEKQRAEYNALLAQINPHFLYNVLESINGLAKIKGQDEIVKIVSSLGYLMRISISGTKAVVDLNDELDYVKNYISILQEITDGRIHVEYDIEDDTLHCKVPKLILQPIIENAIHYGVEDKESGGLIVVSAHKDNDVLKINISDNGKGIEEGRLEEIRLGTNQSDEAMDAHAHIGIKSVDRRVKILYGKEYGLEITSKLGVGTVVEIKIPTKIENLY